VLLKEFLGVLVGVPVGVLVGVAVGVVVGVGVLILQAFHNHMRIFADNYHKALYKFHFDLVR
jgi:hypothetical protein